VSAAPRQVVVGYDGSDRARKTLEVARRIAAPGAKVS
jgi:nucleotide-binding universal stress UspA family protein